jgi:hypothetical protein
MAWIVAAVVGWLVCLLLCWRMGRETGRRGLLYGVLGPLGVVLLAFLPPRKPQSPVVRRLESMGLLGLRIRRETLAAANFTGMQGGWRQQIEEDVTQTEGAGGTPTTD